MEQDVSLYYESLFPGQVRVIGADLYSTSSPALLGAFEEQTGATFPLLLYGSSAAGGNLSSLYGTYDNYVVINKTGIVRYHAADKWPHGTRYHLDEIRGSVDTLVSSTVGVGGEGAPGAAALSAAPNPFGAATKVELTLLRADEHVRITVHDYAGRRVATLWDGPAAAGVARVLWDGRNQRGDAMAAGVYVIRAESGAARLSRRVVLIR